MAKTKYILKGNIFVGGSDISGEGRRFEKYETTLWAEDNEEAREIARQINCNDKELFRQVDIL